MRISVLGAGAVGGYLAARLLKAGRHEVAVVARGAQLRAIEAGGLTLEAPDEAFTVHPSVVTDRPEDLAPQDLVLVTLKAHAQPGAAKAIGSMLAGSGCAVFVGNGIPWWWNHRGDAVGEPLPLVDPDGRLWAEVGPQRAVGCVVYSANEVTSPGRIRHLANNRWLLGEPTGVRSQRLEQIAAVLREAQLDVELVTDIRKQVWLKLLRNVPLNSICALTRLPVNELSFHPQLQALFEAVVEETAAIAKAGGVDLWDHVPIAKTAPQRGAAIDGARSAVIRPSMLQDVLAGREMEIDAILGQVQALARASGTACPGLDVLVPLIRGLDHSMRIGSSEKRRLENA
jgi:2-dehydropantoate 2-reductase